MNIWYVAVSIGNDNVCTLIWCVRRWWKTWVTMMWWWFWTITLRCQGGAAATPTGMASLAINFSTLTYGWRDSPRWPLYSMGFQMWLVWAWEMNSEAPNKTSPIGSSKFHCKLKHLFSPLLPYLLVYCIYYNINIKFYL